LDHPYNKLSSGQDNKLSSGQDKHYQAEGLDELSMKFWVADANVPILGPLLTRGPILGPSAKTAPSQKAVLFNGQILAEAEPELI